MIELIFGLMMIAVFGRLIGIAFRMSWGILKVLGAIIFAPAVIIAMFVGGLVYIAFPVLIVAGIASFFLPE